MIIKPLVAGLLIGITSTSLISLTLYQSQGCRAEREALETIRQDLTKLRDAFR